MTIHRLEQIESWKEARALAFQIYRISNHGELSRDFGLRDQIRKASISIMANIAEGFGRGSKGEFSRFLWIAHASALETQSHLYIASDLGYLTPREFETLHNQVTKVTRMIGGFINYLSQERRKDPNRKPTNPGVRNQGTKELKN